MAKPVLHKSGKTRFTIQNIDYGVLTQALLNYQKLVETTPDEEFKGQLISKEFLVDSCDRLIKTFKIDESEKQIGS